MAQNSDVNVMKLKHLTAMKMVPQVLDFQKTQLPRQLPDQSLRALAQNLALKEALEALLASVWVALLFLSFA